KQHATLLQRLHHQRYISLLEIAHAAMNQLGAAAGSALAEVALLQQQDVVPASGGINCDSDAGGASTNYDHVPRSFSAVEALVHPGPGHLTLKRSVESLPQTALPPCARFKISSASLCGSSTFMSVNRLASPAVSRERLPTFHIRCSMLWSTLTS